MNENALKYLESIKNSLKEFDIDVDKHYYILDYNYEPAGAIYKLSRELNSRNHTMYIKVTDDPEALEIFTDYLNITNPELVVKRNK